MIWKKTVKDFWATKSKTILAFLTLVIGSWALSTIVFTYYISKKDLSDNFLRTNPASIIIKTSGLNDKIIHEIKNTTFVEDIEIKQVGMARLWKRKNEWMPIKLFSIGDFEHQKINTFKLEKGSYPKIGEIVIERDGSQYLINNDLKIQLPNNQEVLIKKSGEVHDPGLPPTHMDHIIWAYTTPETYRSIFKSDSVSQIYITLKSNKLDLNSIQKYSKQLKRKIKHNQGSIEQIIIPPPGKHPHEGQLQSLLFLQLGLGLLMVLLSCTLLVNVISSIMSGQIKQIGSMKATGATYLQMLKMYLSGVIILTLLAIFIALPMGYNSAIAYNKYIANELNFNVINTTIPIHFIVSLVLLLLLIPTLTALYPINKACKMSVKNALNDDKSNSSSNTELFILNIVNILRFPLWIKIVIGNILKNKWGAILIVFNLTLGLSLFTASLNLRSSIQNTFEKTLKKQKYSISITLGDKYKIETVDSILKKLPEIEKTEFWSKQTLEIDNQNVVGPSFNLTAFDENTKLITFNFISGKYPTNWKNTLVVNPEFIGKYPASKVGDSISLYSNGKLHRWYLAGVVKEIGSPGAYTSKTAWEDFANEKQVTSELKIKISNSITGPDISVFMLKTESLLKENNIFIVNSYNQADYLKLLNDHILVITVFLMIMSLLVIFVGGIGIISIMNIKIIDRKREIGIMRAIGGSKYQNNKIILLEIFILGFISWGISWLIAIPISKMISAFFGKLIIETELDFITNDSALSVTFFVTLFILLLSSIIPIRNASKSTVIKAIN